MFLKRLNDTYRHQGMRADLVDVLKRKGISDEAVLRAIRKIPRHFFLDSALDKLAYEDVALPIGDGQTISQPFTVAFQTQLLEIKPKHKVLEIGTGSGYQASVLLEMGADVYSIERQTNLFQTTKTLLMQMGYDHFMHLFFGDGTLGLTSFAPFDRILVTAGAPSVPETLMNQLCIGGILVIPVGDTKNQKMHRIRKISPTENKIELFEGFSFVPLIGQQGW